jgi:hypothetical protein
MSKVIIDMAISLDGCIATREGEDGGLHDYFFSPSGDTAAIVREGILTTGAIIMGLMRCTWSIASRGRSRCQAPDALPLAAQTAYAKSDCS